MKVAEKGRGCGSVGAGLYKRRFVFRMRSTRTIQRVGKGSVKYLMEGGGFLLVGEALDEYQAWMHGGWMDQR